MWVKNVLSFAMMGIDVVLEAVTELEKYCDRRMAAELEKLPAGIYEFEDSLREMYHDGGTAANQSSRYYWRTKDQDRFYGNLPSGERSS
ncbi:MAG: hypothetical protein ACLUOI_34385 [Eisenbergiella sp.]